MSENRPPPDDALRRLLAAARAAPGDPAIAQELAAAYSRLGRQRRAAAVLRRALRREPGRAAAQLQYAEALLRLGKIDAAIAAADAALRLEPGSPEAHRRRGVLLYRRRRFAEAAADFQAWSQAEPAAAEADLALGRALLRVGERNAARDALRRAADRAPGLVRAHLLLARLALAADKLGQAQAHLKRAIESRPQAAGLHALLARVLLRRARPEAAQKAALAALALDPGCDTAELVLAELYIASGNPAQAEPILRRLLLRRPDWPELRALIGRDDGIEPGQPEPPPPEPPPAARTLPAPAEYRPPQPSAAVSAAEPGGFAPAYAGAGLAVAALDAIPFPARADFLDHLFLLQALILRQLRLHYHESRFGFFLEYVRPTVVMVFHYALFTALKKPMPAKIPVELFIIGSFTIWFAAVHVLRATGHTGKDATNIPGVTTLHLAAARALWEFLSMTSYAVACVVLLKLAGMREPIPNVFATAIYFLLAVALGFGLGLILLGLGRVFASTEALKKNIYWILYVTSGHYFSISQGRHGLANIVWYNPILHLSELQRQALYPGYPTELVTYWYPTVTAVLLIIFGLLLEKCTRHRASD